MPGSDDLMLGLHELTEAHESYEEAFEYYRGCSMERFSSPAVARRLARSGQYPVNVAKAPIVVLQSRIQVAGVTVLDADGNKDEAADAEFQQRVVVPNQLGLLWKRVIKSVLWAGDAYLFVWDGDTEGSVRVAYNDPRTTRAIYDPEDDTRLLYVIRRWQSRQGMRASILYGDRLEIGWQLRDGAQEDDPKGWSFGPDMKEVPNPYGRPPVFHFRNEVPYGHPAHEAAYGPQDAISKISNTLGYVTEAAGLSERYALTDPSASLSGDAMDAPDWDDDVDADLVTADDSALRSGPGEIMMLKGIKAVGEWAAAEPGRFTNAAEWYLQMEAITTGVSMHYLDQRGGYPSGESLRVADFPVNSIAKDIVDYLDPEAAHAMAFAALVAGMPDATVDVRWRPTGVVDDLTTWQLVGAKVAQGVPVRRALADTGLYEQAEIDAWLSDASVEMDVAHRIGLLAQVAGAVGQLGQGVALGILDDAQARLVLAQTIGQITPEIATDGTAGAA